MGIDATYHPDDIKEEPVVANKIVVVRTPFLTGTFVSEQQVTTGGNTSAFETEEIAHKE